MAKRAQKYGAKKTACLAGHTHDSGREARRCNELHTLLRAGVITDLVIEPKFILMVNDKPIIMGNGRKAQYRPDFVYRENGELVAEDIKSKPTMTEAFRLRIALFKFCYPEINMRLVF